MKQTILSYKNHLNSIAELGWQEVETTAYIKKTIPLTPISVGIGGKTGLVYKIGSGKKGILLRADIDALKTQHGIRHTCGHSTHTAALMGAIQTMFQEKLSLPNDKTIYFLFQPAEETYPSGARAFLTECSDILPSISYAFAGHVRPKLPRNVVSLPRMVVGRGDYMEITIHGKMVHVKNTPDGKDALEAASHLILFIKSLQKRYNKTLRINIGVIQGGLQPNAVADYAVLKGDIRMKDNRMQQRIQQTIEKKAREIEQKTGVTIDFAYFDGYPQLINDLYLQKTFASILTNSSLSVATDDRTFTFGSEDFAFIAEKIPSLYALIGTGDSYDIHEEACTISDAGTMNMYAYFMQVIAWWTKK
jgi:amidohydrolase